jgi:hypothetical protein
VSEKRCSKMIVEAFCCGGSYAMLRVEAKASCSGCERIGTPRWLLGANGSSSSERCARIGRMGFAMVECGGWNGGQQAD